MVSKTSIGPVDPMMVSGCPENNPYPTPTKNPDIRDSIAAMRFSVASPSKPPKVMIGVRQEK